MYFLLACFSVLFILLLKHHDLVSSPLSFYDWSENDRVKFKQKEELYWRPRFRMSNHFSLCSEVDVIDPSPLIAYLSFL